MLRDNVNKQKQGWYELIYIYDNIATARSLYALSTIFIFIYFKMCHTYKLFYHHLSINLE